MSMKWSRLHVISLILAIIIAALLYLIGYLTYVAPTMEKVASAEQQVTNQEKLIANSKQQLENEESSNLSTDMQLQLPIEKATDQLLLLLNNLEENSVSTITQLSTADAVVEEEEEQQSDVNAIQYQLQVNAKNYHGMYSFLQGLREADRLINIKQLEFRKATDNQLGFTVTFSAFYISTLNDLQVEAPIYEYLPSEKRTTPFE